MARVLVNRENGTGKRQSHRQKPQGYNEVSNLPQRQIILVVLV
jgi:hypothetical protein